MERVSKNGAWVSLVGSRLPASVFSPLVSTILCRVRLLVAGTRSERRTRRSYFKPMCIFLWHVRPNVVFNTIWRQVPKLAANSTRLWSKSTQGRRNICRNLIKQVWNVSNEAEQVLHACTNKASGTKYNNLSNQQTEYKPSLSTKKQTTEIFKWN